MYLIFVFLIHTTLCVVYEWCMHIELSLAHNSKSIQYLQKLAILGLAITVKFSPFLRGPCKFKLI